MESLYLRIKALSPYPSGQSFLLFLLIGCLSSINSHCPKVKPYPVALITAACSDEGAGLPLTLASSEHETIIQLYTSARSLISQRHVSHQVLICIMKAPEEAATQPQQGGLSALANWWG